jgi:hypothetical protein
MTLREVEQEEALVVVVDTSQILKPILQHDVHHQKHQIQQSEAIAYISIIEFNSEHY